MKVKQIKLQFDPTKVSFTVGANRQLAEIRAQATRGTEYFELDDVLTSVPFEDDGGVDPDPDPEPEPDPAPDPGDGLIHAPDGARHEYSQLQVFNNSMDEVILNTAEGQKVFSFPEMQDLGTLASEKSRWYGNTIYGTDETEVTNQQNMIAAFVMPNGDSIWQGGSYEDIGANATLALINDARDRLYIVRLTNGITWNLPLPGGMGGNNINTVVVSPRANYLVFVFNDVGSGPEKGMCLYDLQGNFMRQVTEHHNHFDLGIDSAGKEFLACVEMYYPGAVTEQSIVKHYLDDATEQRVFDVPNKTDGKWDVVGHVTARALYSDYLAFDTEQYVYVLKGPTWEVTARYPLIDVQPGYENQPHPSLSGNGRYIAFKDGGKTVFGGTEV